MEKHKPLPKGTLVRVKESALTPNSLWTTVNNKHVREHGYLYLIDRYNPDGIYECKSLATGMENMPWAPYELEDARDGEA